MRSVRLAFLLYKYFPYGGMQRDFQRFVQECRKLGHACRVYFIDWEGKPLEGVDMRQVPAKAFSHHKRNAKYLQWVQRDMAQDAVDGVIGFNKMPGLDVYYAADSCYLHKAKTERGPLYRRSSRFRHFAAYERAVFAAPASTEILLISETERSKFEQYYHTPAERLHMLPPGISQDRRRPDNADLRRRKLREELLIDGLDYVLLFVGSGFIKKGLDRAIRSVAAIRREQPAARVHLLVVGQDKQGRFRRLAKKLDVQDSVRFLGGRDDIPDLLLASDVLVHPALDEAAGIVLLEALVAGLPVVVTDVCGYAHHIEAGRAGLVLPAPFEQAQLDAALLRMLDGVYRAECRRSALLYAELTDLYSMHETGARLIQELISAKLDGGNV